METITTSLYDNRRKTVERSRDLKESAEMHREIYRAIRSHNPPQAKASMEQHLNLARMAQAAEAGTPQTVTHTPADPAARLVSSRSSNRTT